MINMAPRVSICIPAYNAGKFIEAAISSALSQTYKNIEVIIIDDGSSDSTYELAMRYKSGNVMVIHQENKGASAARNCGLGIATGDWIQFLDADDILHPEKIAIQMERALIDGPEYIYGSDWGRFKENIIEAKFGPSVLLADSTPVDWLIEKYSNNEMIQPGAWLTHRSLIEKSGRWDERLSLNDDGEFFDRVVLVSQGVKYVPGAKTYYRSEVQGSLSGQVSYSSAESAFLAISLCAERLLAARNSIESRSACAKLYALFAYQFYPFYRALAEQAFKKASLLSTNVLDIPGGRYLKHLQRFIGWRKTRMLQHFYYRLRY